MKTITCSRQFEIFCAADFLVVYHFTGVGFLPYQGTKTFQELRTHFVAASKVSRMRLPEIILLCCNWSPKLFKPSMQMIALVPLHYEIQHIEVGRLNEVKEAQPETW